ncbi:MAG: hypothetical protein ACRDT4_10480 [Micromonosporaceae bacterium]
MTTELAPEAVADTGAFLARLVRLDPAALVRLRPARAGAVALWAALPFDVLATRLVPAGLTDDVTVRAAELLAVLERGERALPPRHDAAWRTPLPPDGGEPLETVPTGEIRRITRAAAQTVRDAGAAGVGERRLRDELLDHSALIITVGSRREELPLRLVVALARMGFLGPDDTAAVTIRAAGSWFGAEARYGTAWYRPASTLRISPVRR